ncbi:AMP-binding protein [Nocardioides panzhihuensis]|uniref:Acyl-CoA synthetase (AMP-forming)/AMP-acid ligase II n=1 Tax=Nocardioides panzhihuensis TaxID=860243 RepID=A0A7Z0DMC2_9ACTN|nr:AMP-binding protein [Nocardioides panzhihuensis]NYI78280.1 acyl-CoA synthetase (AMP-forming)/AMP-acid ligase II [Nocardioides panzhihuensis]
MDLSVWAGEQPDKAAVIDAAGAVIAYAELEAASNRIAHLFRELGLSRGDHIAILSENRLDLFPVLWAAQRTGLYYTPVNWHLTAGEAAYVVENCGARLVVASATLADLAAELPEVEHRFSLGGAVPGHEPLEPRVELLPATPVEDQSEGCYMLYSSGTTGRPKGILPMMPDAPFGTGMPFDHLMQSAFGFSPETIYLSPGPLYHAAPLGWSLGAIRAGGTTVIMDRFDPEIVLRLIERDKVTHAQFVPTMFVRMLKLPDDVRSTYALDSLRLVIHAAAPCPVEVKRAMIEWLGPILVEFYAGSEGNCFFSIDSPTWLDHPGSVGRSVLGVVHVCDESGRELPTGEVGQLWFSDASPFEYHGDPEKTAAAFDARGWSTLGDLGRVDEDGFLYLADRRTDLIISGGVNIYPREIEEALILHPSVADVAVLGVPDEEFGHRVHAVVSPADGIVPGPELEAELTAYVRQQVAGFKIPRSWAFEDVPRLPSGKILRRVLLERFRSEAV